jgi:hypothetical protein
MHVEGYTAKEIGNQSGMNESAAANLSEYFSRWMRNGLLARYEYTTEQPK